ncbi:MFS general substrate transporter [Apiospora kogelbergensis]|uniref:MFS general substrate transporter n=1 Tax=Apiospora kogelbergensis TaxID=1337665 RepID=A0AAW0Q5B4_9PEZI
MAHYPAVARCQQNGHRGNRGTHHDQIPDSLALLNDNDLREDARRFAQKKLGMEGSQAERLVRAAFVARDANILTPVLGVAYNRLAHGEHDPVRFPLQVALEEEELEALMNERDKLFSERDIMKVTVVVCSAAFLQGHVQASFNSSSLYPKELGVYSLSGATDAENIGAQWALGGLNAVPWFAAAILGCTLAPVVNNLFGRKGAIAISASLILVSSIVSGLIPLFEKDYTWIDRWRLLFSIRIINGIGMGIKAVSTPILASETAIRFWRGSFILAWQLWVACGLMAGLLLNLIFAATIKSNDIVVSLMLGSPFIPAVLLLIFIWSCPESPRFYMQLNSKNYNPKKAYEELRKIRGSCELLALKDIYLLHKTIEEEHRMQQDTQRRTWGLFDLFTQTRLRNALISASTVALSQQLCGINVSAFYSGTLFLKSLGSKGNPIVTALGLSFGFGAVNFFCGLPAIKTIDTLVHAAAYAPGLGPIPFTLASESFPQSHREIGCACVISVNLFFAGLLSIFYPRISDVMTPPGSLGLFSGLTLLAWVLVYFLVEETRELSLENLYHVFSEPKGKFAHLKYRRLLYLGRRYLLRDKRAKDPADDEEGSFNLEGFEISAETRQGGTSVDGSRPVSHVDPRAPVELVHRGDRVR